MAGQAAQADRKGVSAPRLVVVRVPRDTGDGDLGNPPPSKRAAWKVTAWLFFCAFVFTAAVGVHCFLFGWKASRADIEQHGRLIPAGSYEELQIQDVARRTGRTPAEIAAAKARTAARERKDRK